MRLICGDMLEVLPTLEAGSVDAVVTDPPYGLGFMGKQWDTPGSFVERRPEKRNRFDHVGGNHNPVDGFDRARTYRREGVRYQGWCQEWAAAALRVVKPGGYLLAFGGTRTFHRLACALEDAGWEMRDTLMWLHGQGFPKGKGCLKPAWEPILFGRKSGPRVLPLGIEACRIPTDEVAGIGNPSWGGPMKRLSAAPGQEGRLVPRTPPANAGRWPANVLHDGSPEVLEAFAVYGERSGEGAGRKPRVANGYGANFMDDDWQGRDTETPGYADSGTAARFFYTAKASSEERGRGNNHPTVKPLSLMRWLAKLVCPVGGTVLDPFCGSGTTGVACLQEDRVPILIEREPAYVEIVRRRLINEAPLFNRRVLRSDG